MNNLVKSLALASIVSFASSNALANDDTVAGAIIGGILGGIITEDAGGVIIGSIAGGALGSMHDHDRDRRQRDDWYYERRYRGDFNSRRDYYPYTPRWNNRRYYPRATYCEVDRWYSNNPVTVCYYR